LSGLEWLAAGGAALLGLGVAAPALRRGATAGLLLQATGIAALGLVGALVLFGSASLGSEFGEQLAPRLGIDGLSGFFLATIAVAGLPALLYARGYLAGGRRQRLLVSLIGVFLVALCAVLTARDPLTFLAGWELMTLAPAAAILAREATPSVRHAVYVYLAMTHLGGAGVWISLLALAHYGALSEPGALAAQGSAAEALVLVAAIVGFGTKAGLMPLHSWLPRAHPVAPAPFSALMSGLMVKVALYGLVRVLFEWASPAPLWSGLTLLALGLLSALAGAIYALFERDLKRLLAFSTIENVGIVALALGVSLAFADAGDATWAAIAFAAGMLHVLNHATFKALLFLAAGSIERAAGGLDLDRLGGLLRRMPWTGGAFLVGAAAIAGLPPLNGFASEWLVLQSLIHVAFGSASGVGLVGAIAAGGLAATAAIALFAFVKAVGMSLLGATRTAAAAEATDPGLSMRLAPAVLAGVCVALAAAPGLLLPSLTGLVGAPDAVPREPGLAVPGTGSLPSPWLLFGLAALVALLWAVSRSRRLEPAPAWVCGQPQEPRLAWTSDSFTKPLRLVLEGVLRARREIEPTETGGTLQSVSYRGEVPHLFDTAVYGPLQRRAIAAARFARRVQSGSVRAYAGYLLALLLAALLAVRIGVIG
jgi:formate hydrogenlyase subunit 3/multisubunit Na+/H+ antiporter MnhD subunit